VTESAAPRARRSRLRPVLAASFYDRETEDVARDLLGCVLASRTPEGLAAGVIVETEAYLGPHDPACHAAAGLTERTHHLHGPPGTAYVYFIYGMHWCVNAVTREQGHGSAVLLRALEPIVGLSLMRARRPRARTECDLTSGPARLCEALAIDGRHNGQRLFRGSLRIHEGESVPAVRVGVSARIGITKAHDWPLRFFVRGHPCVSGPRSKE
jgi:DNA-3-methyladenine glycosylase